MWTHDVVNQIQPWLLCNGSLSSFVKVNKQTSLYSQALGSLQDMNNKNYNDFDNAKLQNVTVTKKGIRYIKGIDYINTINQQSK